MLQGNYFIKDFFFLIFSNLTSSSQHVENRKYNSDFYFKLKTHTLRAETFACFAFSTQLKSLIKLSDTICYEKLRAQINLLL